MSIEPPEQEKDAVSSSRKMLSASSSSNGSAKGAYPPGNGRGNASSSLSGHQRFPWLMGFALLLVVMLLGISIIYALPGILRLPGPSASTASILSTITIAPDNQVMIGSYAITGVGGTPDATKLQVNSRQVSGTAQTAARTVTTTGYNQTPGTHVLLVP